MRSSDAGAVAAVFVAQVGTQFVASTQVVSALFSLTPAESRLFEHIVAGHSQRSAAAALGVKASTVKTHLLRIYEKLGVRRQTDLVRISASLMSPIDTSPNG